MKLATIRFNGNVLAGIVKDNSFYSFQSVNKELPGDMLSFIDGYEQLRSLVDAADLAAMTPTCSTADAAFLAPLPNPRSMRDFMGFEEHVKNCGRRFHLDTYKMLESWYTMPAFYYSNNLGIIGSDETLDMHPHAKMFDFEFEIGFVIGRGGRNIPADQAMDHIFGYTVLNDWSARDIQMKEMNVGIGIPKAKDYATSIGPVIVTADEMEQYLCPDDPTRFDLTTRLTRNGQLMRENNTRVIYHTFAKMIEWASRDCTIYPGELFGSGTIGGGALLEYTDEVPWLHAGDLIEMEVQGIGTLKNKIV